MLSFHFHSLAPNVTTFPSVPTPAFLLQEGRFWGGIRKNKAITNVLCPWNELPNKHQVNCCWKIDENLSQDGEAVLPWVKRGASGHCGPAVCDPLLSLADAPWASADFWQDFSHPPGQWGWSQGNYSHQSWSLPNIPSKFIRYKYSLWNPNLEMASRCQVSHRRWSLLLCQKKTQIMNHYRTLEYLIRHLAHIASFSSKTNMHARNLALVWAPNLLR
jgi:hypothetical protein